MGLAALVGCTAVNAGVIEQSSGVFDAAIFAFDPIGQSFVAEDAGLGQIAFSFAEFTSNTSSDGLVTMTLYEGSGFGGTVLGSVTQDVSGSLPDAFANVINFIDFDFTGVTLTVGQTYTAAVTATDASIAINFLGSDGYAGGQLFESSSFGLSGCSPSSLCDLDFRVTPSAVPVPAAVWLFGSGLLGLVGVARRRKA